jgi:tetratricopeptide (TPR) repeat protein
MVEGNRRSYLAAKAELKDATMDVGTYDALHAMDYMVFGELQQAHDDSAAAIVRETAAIKKVNVENFPAAYAFAAIPSRFALERRDWQAAAALSLSPAGLSWDKFPQAESVLVFSRGLGAARAGNLEQARRDLQRLEDLKAAMVAAKVGYWPSQSEFQIKGVAAWIAMAEGRHAQALALMTEAADLEEASDKHPVTPGNVIPSRELLGEMLMTLNRPADALVEFRRSLKRDPNRYQTIVGAARAARAMGASDEAGKLYRELVALGDKAQSRRPELAEAKAYLGK